MRALYAGFQGSESCAPGNSDTWAIAIGVWVEPGPSTPPSEPAMTRMMASPFSFVNSDTDSASMSW